MRLISTILTILCIALPLSAQSPIAHYTFDTPGSPGLDSIGVHHATTLSGVIQVVGLHGQAASFTNGYLRVANVPDLNFGTGNFTLSLFFKASGTSGTQGLLEKRTGNAEYMMDINVRGDGRLRAVISDAQNRSIQVF